MPSISDTRAAIKDALVSINVRAYDYSPNTLSNPCAIVGFPTRYLPSDTLSDTATFTIPVTMYVGYAANRAAEDNLESYLNTSGDASIIAAVEAIGDEYHVAAVRDFGVLQNEDGAPIALGCVIDVEVFA